MKQLIKFSLLFLLCVSCSSNSNLDFLSQEIIDGKISATEPGSRPGYHHTGNNPIIYIQNDKVTRRIEIPFEYEDKWKVGDSCLLIVQKYLVNQN